MALSLGISGIFRQDQLAGGVYSYFENLLRGFGEHCRDPQFPCDFDLKVFHGRASLPWEDDRFCFRRIQDRYSRFVAETKVGLIDSRALDAILFTNYFTPPVVRAKRSLTVIHDLQYLHMPEFYTLAKKLWLKKCHLHTLRRSDAVITISETVKQDLLQQYGSKWEDRIHAVWNPVSLERFRGMDEQQFTGGRPYVMCVAMDRPQKNLFTLVHAFDRLKDRFPDLCLVMAGQLRTLRKRNRDQSKEFAEKMPSTVDLVNSLGLQERVLVTGFIPDQQLGALYRGASVFVLPSEFEGFGMPAVESLAMGAPTLVSGLPVLREVTLNQAHYVENPRDAGEMSDKIATILTNPESYRPSAKLVEDIRRRFSPATIARQYLDLMIPSCG